MDSFLSLIFRQTILYDTFAPKDSRLCMRSLNKAPFIEELRESLRYLLLPEFISCLPKDAQKALIRIVNEAEDQFDACKHGKPLWKITVSIFVALLFAFLPLIEAGLLGERVFIVRNFAFLVIYTFEILVWISYRYTTRHILSVIIRERVAILLIVTVFYIPPAFVSDDRYLYEENWYIILSIAMTACWLYVFQFHTDAMRMLELRSIRRQTGKMPPCIQTEEQIFNKLSSLSLLFDDYSALMAMYRHNNLISTLDSLQKGRFIAIKDTLLACLPEQARTKISPTAVPEQQAKQKRDRKVKLVFSIIAFAVLVANLVSLWGFWLSVAQAVISLVYISKILWSMVAEDYQTLERFFGVFNALIVISVFIFCHVSIPLFIDKDIFDKNLALWLATNAATLVECLLLTKPTVAGVMWICEKLGVVQKDEAADQLGEEVAQEKAGRSLPEH